MWERQQNQRPREKVAVKQQSGGAPLTAETRTGNQRVTGRYAKSEEKDDAVHRLIGDTPPFSKFPGNVSGIFQRAEPPRAGFRMLQILTGSFWREARSNAGQARSGT